MDIFEIDGPVKLSGTIDVAGSKNSALPILAAALLAPGVTVIPNAPNLADIRSFETLLDSLGAKVSRDETGGCGSTRQPSTTPSASTRSSARCVPASASSARCWPGAARSRSPCPAAAPSATDRWISTCAASRPSAPRSISKTAISSPKPPPADWSARKFPRRAVRLNRTGTDNVMMAAVLAKGTTVIESAACEPEVADLANCLNAMGAKISGIGSPRLIIEGVKELNPVNYPVIGDRIEAGTFMVAAAITKSHLQIRNCDLNNMVAVVDRFRHIGVQSWKAPPTAAKSPSTARFDPADITTQPYPGFPDRPAGAVYGACWRLAKATASSPKRSIPDRFMHVAELNRMAANLRKEGPSVIIAGVEKLVAAPVMASDLRASAALVLAGMAADGTTVVHRVYHIDRGYKKIEEKLNAVGAKIRRISV